MSLATKYPALRPCPKSESKYFAGWHGMLGTAAVSLFRSGSLYVTTVTLVAGDQSAQDGANYRVPKKDLVSVTQVLLQTGRLKIARELPHAELLARELMNFRSRVTAQTAESQLDWRER